MEVDVGQVNLYGSYNLGYQEAQQKRSGRVRKSIFRVLTHWTQKPEAVSQFTAPVIPDELRFAGRDPESSEHSI